MKCNCGGVCYACAMELNAQSSSEYRERESRVKYLKDLGYKLRKVSRRECYALYGSGLPKKVSYEELNKLYLWEKMTHQEGYARVLFNNKSLIRED